MPADQPPAGPTGLAGRCCPVCWETFTSPNPQRVYCSDRCRRTAHARRHATPSATSSTTAPGPIPAPVAVRACPHCGEHISIVALLTTPEAARPNVPEPGVIPLRRA